jgi:hypothetical protein
MADPNDMNDDMIGTQLPSQDIEDMDDDTMADGDHEHHDDEPASDEEAAPEHDYQDDDEENLTHEDNNGEEELLEQEFPGDEDVEEAPAHDYPMALVERQDDMGQYPQDQQEDQQEDIRESVESLLEPEPCDAAAPLHDPESADVNMHDTPEEQLPYEHPEATFQDNDSSTLFVPERGSPSPDMSRLPGRPSATTSAPTPPSAPRQKVPGNSVFAKIRNMQKMAQDRKLAANRQKQTYPITSNPDNETYLEAVLQKPSSSSNVPAIDEDEVLHQQATREYEKQKRHYADLKKKSGGELSFRHSIEWMKVKGAEDARSKKRARDIAKAREEEEGEPDLFPDAYHAPVNEEEEESDDETFDFEQPGARKRRRPMPKKSGNQISMQEAELQSMRVALEADGDMPKKKRKGAAAEDDSSEAAPSGRGKGKAKATGRPSRAKAAPKRVTKSGGGRGSTKKNKQQVEYAVKQATSLFNSNVFQQQAGAGAAEQPTFRSRKKADALKELIASVPLDDLKQARGDMNTLLAATKDFDGRGSVKSDGKGLWIVKGMKTSLKGYQVLGTAFMRRRENATEEPKGGLMADQMGLGKTLMMLGMYIAKNFGKFVLTSGSEHSQRSAA